METGNLKTAKRNATNPENWETGNWQLETGKQKTVQLFSLLPPRVMSVDFQGQALGKPGNLKRELQTVKLETGELQNGKLETNKRKTQS